MLLPGAAAPRRVPPMSEVSTDVAAPADRAVPTAPRPGANLEARLVRLLGATVERMPWASCRLTGAWLGLWMHHGLPRRRAIAVANVRLAFPALGEAAA